jgi:hypothetical protein
MPNEVTMFILIHVFLGLVLPFMVMIGCCRERDEEAPVAVRAKTSGD